MSKDTRWDRDLSVAAEADGLTGHTGAVLLRKLADQCGLTAALGSALARAGKFPLIDRGAALAPQIDRANRSRSETTATRWSISPRSWPVNDDR